MTDLDKLIDAVEGGTAVVDDFHESRISFSCEDDAWDAYHGSLDAAKALHEALLPGYRWSIQGDTGRASVWGADSDGAHTAPSNPARAWLIAILKAYRAQQEG